MNERKKIVVWCGDAANQKALANKIAREFNLCGIVIDQKKNFKKKSLLKKLLPALRDRVFFKTIINAWSSLQQNYAQQYPTWPYTSHITVDSINSDEAFNFTQQLSPDLVVVSGTGLVKSKMLSLRPSIGIINLHTGLSPYVKGGPNCTNWCIANNDWHLTGNTIMWINEGIDSGNIITSEHISVRELPNLLEVQKKVMEQAHDLYLRAIDYLLHASPPYNSVSQQSLGDGRLFLTKMWTAVERKNLLKNWKRRDKYIEKVTPVTVNLPGYPE